MFKDEYAQMNDVIKDVVILHVRRHSIIKLIRLIYYNIVVQYYVVFFYDILRNIYDIRHYHYLLTDHYIKGICILKK